jgi:hypothetical protein
MTSTDLQQALAIATTLGAGKALLIIARALPPPLPGERWYGFLYLLVQGIASNDDLKRQPPTPGSGADPNPPARQGQNGPTA